MLPIRCTFSSYTEYVKRENIVFPLFFKSTLLTIKHKKIVGERISTFCVQAW